MGNTNVSFFQSFNTLEDMIPSPSDHEFWIPVFTTSISKDDLYSLLNPKKIRTIASKNPLSLCVLLYKCIEQLHVFSQTSTLWSGQLDSVKNALIIIMRVVPIMYEKEEWKNLLQTLFENNTIPIKYQESKESKESNQSNQSNELKESNSENTNDNESTQSKNAPNDTTSFVKIDRIGTFSLSSTQLGELLLHTILQLMFLPHFSIPEAQISWNASQKFTVEHPALDISRLWQGGLLVPPSSCWCTAQQKEFRIIMMKCLLALFSFPVFTDANHFLKTKNYFLDILVRKNTPNTYTLFYSLLNCFVLYNPSGWLPYTTTLLHDNEEDYIMTCLHLLCLVLYHSPEQTQTVEQQEGTENSTNSIEEPNVFLDYIRELQDSNDIIKLHQGFQVILRNVIDANSTYLPSSQKLFECHDEILIVLWRIVELSKTFRTQFFKKSDQNQILESLLVMFENSSTDSSKFAFTQIVSLLILMFSQYRDFCISLNKPFSSKLPMDVQSTSGNYADILILTIHKVISKDSGHLKPLYFSLITTISNISPYIKKLSVHSSVKLVALFSLFSKPSFLYSAPRNWELIDLLLRTFNNLIQYQYEGSVNLVYTILRKRDLFETLSLKPNIESLNELNEELVKGTNDAPFVVTPEWLSTWKPNLQLKTILALINGLESDIEEIMSSSTPSEDELLTFLKSTTPIGMIPSMHMILVKTFSTTPQIRTFINVYLYGLMYVRHMNPPLFSPQKIRLFRINSSEADAEE